MKFTILHLCWISLCMTCYTLEAEDNHLSQKPMVVIIPSYNNQQWVEKNLTSVFKQQYDNYHIIYIDDCSSDGTYAIAQKITQQYKQQPRTTIIRNTERYGAMANLYTAIHSCNDTDVIVTLDGDDWFAHDQVLNKLNSYYARDIWMTYGQFQEYPTNRIGHCIPFPEEIIKNNGFRTFHTNRSVLPASHLRTFYAWLFKSIQLKDLLYEDYFYAMGWDIAFICPLLEMAGTRHQCIDDVLYIYNIINPLSDCYRNASLQLHLAQYVLNQHPYNRLDTISSIETFDKDDRTSLILLATQGLSNIYTLLTDVYTSIKPLTTLSLLYDSSYEDIHTLDNLSSLFPSVSVKSYNKESFKNIVEKCINVATENYIFLATDTMTIRDSINCTASIRALKKSHTTVYYCALAKKNTMLFAQPHLAPVNSDHSVYAWYSNNKKGTWVIPTIDGTLWKKRDLQKLLTSCSYYTPDELRTSLHDQVINGRLLGLVNIDAKIIRN